MQSAGFSLPTVDQDTVHVGYPNAFVLMEHLQVWVVNAARKQYVPHAVECFLFRFGCNLLIF